MTEIKAKAAHISIELISLRSLLFFYLFYWQLSLSSSRFGIRSLSLCVALDAWMPFWLGTEEDGGVGGEKKIAWIGITSFTAIPLSLTLSALRGLGITISFCHLWRELPWVNLQCVISSFEGIYSTNLLMISRETIEPKHLYLKDFPQVNLNKALIEFLSEGISLRKMCNRIWSWKYKNYFNETQSRSKLNSKDSNSFSIIW